MKDINIGRKEQKINQQIIWILGIGLIGRMIIAFFLPPGYDEAYYYLYSKYLNWSYFDHPLLVAFTTGIGVWLTGMVNQFTIRIGGLILHTVSLYLLYLTAKKLFNAETGYFTLLIASLIPIFNIAFGVLTLPDVPLMFFWTLTLYIASAEFFRQREYQPSYRLILICVAVGGACLSKYHGFTLGFSLIGFCLSAPHHRQAFKSVWLWLGLLVFMVILFPLWYWNWQHDWISLGFQLSGRFEGGERQINVLNLLVYFFATIGYLFPSFGFPLWWIAIKATLIEILQRPHYPSQLILWFSLPLMVGFTFLGALTQILPTWALAGFWSMTILLGYYTSVWTREFPQRVKNWLTISGGMVNTIILIILLHFTTGLLQKPNQYPFPIGFISPQNDPSHELLDVVQLGKQFQSSPQFQQVINNSDFVFTNVYYLGGYLAMALAQNEATKDMPVTCFSDDVRGFSFWHPLPQFLGKNALYITTETFGSDAEANQEFANYFADFNLITEITVKRAGAVTETVYIYEGKNFQTIPNYIPQHSKK